MTEGVADRLLGYAIKVQGLLCGMKRQHLGEGKPDIGPPDEACLTCEFGKSGGQSSLDQARRNQAVREGAGSIHPVMQLRGQVVELAVQFGAGTHDLLGEHINHAGHARKQLAEIVVQLLSDRGTLAFTDAKAFGLKLLFP